MSKTKQKRLAASFLLLLLCATPIWAAEHVDVSTGTETINGASGVNYSGQGGAVSVINGATAELSGTFSNNSAQQGGAASIYQAIGEVVNGAVFDGNHAVNAGAISNVFSDLTIGDGVTFKNNYSENYAGAILNQSSNLTIGNDVKFLNNCSNKFSGSDSGGAIVIDTNAPSVNSTVVIGNNALFDGNTTGRSGGAIYVYESSGKVNVSVGDNATFTDNHSNGKNGGAIAIYGATGTNDDGTNTGFSIGKNSTFSGNTSSESGGAIYVSNWNGSDTVLSIDGGAKFENNSADTSGGAIENTAGLILDTSAGNIEFSNNNVNGVLNDINTTGNITMSGDSNSIILNTITGSVDAKINKTGENTLVLNDKNSGYLGDFNQSAGSTEVNSEFFGGDSNISGGSLALKDGSSVVASSSVKLTNDAQMTTEGDVSINGSVFQEGSGSGDIVNIGNLEISGNGASLIGKVSQNDSSASITVSDNGTFGTSGTISAGSLSVLEDGIIDGVVNVTEDVKLTVVGETIFDTTGLQAGGGHITNSGVFSLGGSSIKVDGNIAESVTLADGAKLTPVDSTKPITIGGNSGKDTVITYTDGAISEVGVNFVIAVDNSDDATLKLAPSAGQSFDLNSDVSSSADGVGNVLVDQIVEKNPNFIDSTTTPDEKEFIEKGVGTVNINSNNDGFTGNYIQKMGNVILSAGKKFFAGTNTVEGGTLTISEDAVLGGTNTIKAGTLNLKDKSLLAGGVDVTAENGKYGTVNIYNKLVGTITDAENPDKVIISADEIGNGNNEKVTFDNSDGSANQEITFTNGTGLGLFNGTIIQGDLELHSDSGVRDLTLGNESGIDAENISLLENTKLTYMDGAYIREDSNLSMKDGASLNFANQTTDINYVPVITGTADSTINKSGAGSTVISSTLENFVGNVNVTGGTLDLATEETKNLNNVNVANANLHVGSDVNVAKNVSAANADVTVDKSLNVTETLTSTNSSVYVKENISAKTATVKNSTVNAGGEMTVTDTFNAENSALAVGSDLTSGETFLDKVKALISGNAKTDNLTVKNNSEVDISGDLTSADTQVSDSVLTVRGKAETGDLTATNSTLSVASDLTSGNTVLDGTNTVVGGNVTTGDLTVKDAEIGVGGDVKSGTTILDKVKAVFSGKVETGDLTATNSTLSVASDLTSGNTVLDGTNTVVGGNATTGDLTVKDAEIGVGGDVKSGTTILDKVKAVFSGKVETGDLTATNSTLSVASDLTSGNTILDSTNIVVGGNVTTKDLTVKNGELIVPLNLTSGNTILDAANVLVNGDMASKDLSLVNDSSLTLNGNLEANNALVSGANSVLNLNGTNSSFDSLTLIDGTINNNNDNMSIAGAFNVGSTGLSTPTLNMMNGDVRTITADSMNMSSDLNINFDVNPSAGYAMDSIKTNTYNDNGNQLIVTGINFITSPLDRNFIVDAKNFISSGDGNVASFGESSFISNTHMGRYLMRTGAGGGSAITGSLQWLNPQMYRGQVATISSYMNQLVVNNMLFEHMDVITRQLIAESNTANKYAATEPLFAPYQYTPKDGNLWYKAYGNFERLSMTRGLSVGNNAYGSLIGADFPVVDLKNGWKLIPTAYIGYNGAHQTFQGVSMYQNGGQIGAMGTAYKGDFISSLLVYGGGYANEMNVNNSTFGGATDRTGNWFAGVASKTAYNFHVAKDLIFQPTALISYNIFGNQNYHSNFGVMGMNAGFLNGINLAPGMNLIWSKKTFSLYATVQYMYNIMGCVDGRAGNVKLDGVRMRHGYLEYGLGVTKTFQERLASYFQFTIRNGGRTGIGFQLGLSWKL